jgi:hypothetical protein
MVVARVWSTSVEYTQIIELGLDSGLKLLYFKVSHLHNLYNSSGSVKEGASCVSSRMSIAAGRENRG